MVKALLPNLNSQVVKIYCYCQQEISQALPRHGFILLHITRVKNRSRSSKYIEKKEFQIKQKVIVRTLFLPNAPASFQYHISKPMRKN